MAAKLADPNSTLGKLQRGRGDVIRELLDAPDDPASHQVLIDCLCTTGAGYDLASHHPGYRELLLALNPELTPWLEHVSALSQDASDEEDEQLEFHYRLLCSMIASGSIECREFMRHEITHGANWREAIGRGLRFDLDLESWKLAIRRMTDADLSDFYNPLSEHWQLLEGVEERVAKMVKARRAKKAASYDEAGYAAAEMSQGRWQYVLLCIEREDPRAPSMLVDGLWDGSALYRRNCIERVNLTLPGVRERLTVLASNLEGEREAKAAMKRLMGR